MILDVSQSVSGEAAAQTLPALCVGLTQDGDEDNLKVTNPASFFFFLKLFYLSLFGYN